MRPHKKKKNINKKIIDNDEIYTIATREYLANGGDGFEVYKNGEQGS